ncbi:MAG: M16 family metallopeptidase, partial [Gemmatimonadaceae bacterium]
LNAGTIYDHTSYYTVLPSSGFVKGLEIQADAYANSVIDAAELAKELEVIIQEAKRKEDNPGAVAVETLHELLHDRHRIRRWRIGREPGLRSLTRDDLLRFYRDFYRPRVTILSIVGDVDPDFALREVERLYGALTGLPVRRTPGPEEPERKGFRYRELSGDITQTQLAVGWRTPGSRHAETPCLDLAACVLGTGRASRLYRAVRERKLAASVSSHNYTPTELGVFTIHQEGPPETTADAARAIWAQLRELRECGVGRDELWRARRIFESRWIRRLETTEGQANYLAEWEAQGDWVLGERYLERLLTASEAHVSETVRRYLVPERAGVLAYRPASAPPLAAGPVQMLELLERARPQPLPVPPPRIPAPQVAHAGRPALESEEGGGRVRVYRTRGGVPVLVRRKDGAPLMYFGVYAMGGASEEDERLAGLTALLTRTAIKGTARRTSTQIAEDAELLGGSIGTSTGAESFGWSLSVPVSHSLAALELLADVVQGATIPNEALETERAVAIADLALLRDDMYRYPLRLLTRAAFPCHTYGVPASGTEESLARIEVEHVRDWLRRRVHEGALVIAAVGDVEPDEVATWAATCFGHLRATDPIAPAAPRWPDGPMRVTESREKAQTALALAFPAPSRTDHRRHAAHLLAGVASGLGGRFFDELRDRQSLAYTVSAFSTERRLAGMFVSYIATSPEKEEIARGGLLREFARLRDADVTDAELTRAKEYAIGTHAIRQQSGGAVLGDVVDAWMFGRLSDLEEHDERVRAVTAREMQALARDFFEEDRVVEAVVRGMAQR